ncbi:uncharacterized [Tachysurus ichikawai]
MLNMSILMKRRPSHKSLYSIKTKAGHTGASCDWRPLGKSAVLSVIALKVPPSGPVFTCCCTERRPAATFSTTLSFSANPAEFRAAPPPQSASRVEQKRTAVRCPAPALMCRPQRGIVAADRYLSADFC